MSVVSATEITGREFGELLRRYPSFVQELSALKSAKNGRTLQELDHYRYERAPAAFGLDKPERDMKLDDIKALVEWKLRHGKFRPTLMSLVSSNGDKAARDTVQQAITKYKTSKDTKGAITELAKLKGIGPATASLLLSVHDSKNAIFFSDEAFYWLCCDGRAKSISYNVREYLALDQNARALAARLDVPATDIEKVAYVLMKEGGANPSGSSKVQAAKTEKTDPSETTSAKRKGPSAPRSTEPDTPVRRSKRVRT